LKGIYCSGVARNAPTSYLKPLTSYLKPLTAYLFCFLPFLTFAQAPEPGCNCIVIENLCWATCNVAEPYTFADSPTDTGWYYQWGVNVGWSPTDPKTDSNGGTTWSSASHPLNAPNYPDEWLLTPCPDGWRLPTRLELADLDTHIVTNGSAIDRLKGMAGRFFNSGDPNQPLLFLPAAGNRTSSDGSFGGVGTTGYYWSSMPTSTNTRAYNLTFLSVAHTQTTEDMPKGFTLRCVADL